MAYTAWSVVAGEQPTAAKWNQLGSNDASFNDGTGIGTNAIAAASLSTSAIKLGYVEVTATFSTASSTAVQITGATITVTIPAGGRSVLVIGSTPRLFNQTQPNNGAAMSLWDGTVGSGTQLQSATMDGYTVNNGGNGVTVFAIVTPAAGSKTYNLGLNRITGGTAQVSAAAGSPLNLAALVV